MSNMKMSKLAIVTIAAGVVILLSAETTQAGGFSVRIGGIGFGSWNTRCVERSYIYVSDYDDDWDCNRYVVRERYCPRPRVYYNTRPYRGGGRFYTMPYRDHGGRRGGRHGGGHRGR